MGTLTRWLALTSLFGLCSCVGYRAKAFKSRPSETTSSSVFFIFESCERAEDLADCIETAAGREVPSQTEIQIALPNPEQKKLLRRIVFNVGGRSLDFKGGRLEYLQPQSQTPYDFPILVREVVDFRLRNLEVSFARPGGIPVEAKVTSQIVYVLGGSGILLENLVLSGPGMNLGSDPFTPHTVNCVGQSVIQGLIVHGVKNLTIRNSSVSGACDGLTAQVLDGSGNPVPRFSNDRTPRQLPRGANNILITSTCTGRSPADRQFTENVTLENVKVNHSASWGLKTASLNQIKTNGQQTVDDVVVDSTYFSDSHKLFNDVSKCLEENGEPLQIPSIKLRITGGEFRHNVLGLSISTANASDTVVDGVVFEGNRLAVGNSVLGGGIDAKFAVNWGEEVIGTWMYPDYGLHYGIVSNVLIKNSTFLANGNGIGLRGVGDSDDEGFVVEDCFFDGNETGLQVGTGESLLRGAHNVTLKRSELYRNAKYAVSISTDPNVADSRISQDIRIDSCNVTGSYMGYYVGKSDRVHISESSNATEFVNPSYRFYITDEAKFYSGHTKTN